MSEVKREHWGSTWGFVMAAAGSAIGLGNIWRFPYITGMNGGGAFVLVYLCCMLLIGLPVMLAEFAMGRASQSDPIGAFNHFKKGSELISRCFAGVGLMLGAMIAILSQNYGLAAVVVLVSLAVLRWGFTVAGFFCSLVALLILSYYAVIGGWTLIYTWDSFAGNLNFASKEEAATAFGAMATNGKLCSIGMLIYLLICAGVCYGGVKKGVELASKLLMPLLFVLVVVLVIRSVTLPGASEGIKFLLKPDFSQINEKSVLDALGHAFYSLSLGMGILITYGSYLPRDRNILSSAVSIAFFDTLLAMLAGLAIFPAVFAMKLSPEQGPSLIFQILPITFNAIPGSLGWLWNGLFFILLSIAALTSGISLLECGTATVMQHLKLSRRMAVTLLTIVIGAFALLSSFGVASWDNFKDLEAILTKLFGSVKGSFLDELDYICSNWILPLNGMVIALFVGWIWGVGKCSQELCNMHGHAPLSADAASGVRSKLNMPLSVKAWSIFIRFIAPLLTLLTFLAAIGVIKL